MILEVLIGLGVMAFIIIKWFQKKQERSYFEKIKLRLDDIIVTLENIGNFKC